MLAINVSGINEEEAGALNGHDVPVKNDYTRHRRFIQGPLPVRQYDRCIISIREGRKDSFLQIRSQESRSLGARYNNFHSRVIASKKKKKKKKHDYPIFRNGNELIDARISSRGFQEIVPRVLRPGTRRLPRKPLVLKRHTSLIADATCRSAPPS